MSKASEETASGEGLALGAVMLGIEGVTGNKTTLEFSFRTAWKNWPYRSHFPIIKAGPRRDDVFHILQKSSSRSTHHVAEWHGAWPFLPVLLYHWTFRELADSIHQNIPAEAWRDLVQNWLGQPS